MGAGDAKHLVDILSSYSATWNALWTVFLTVATAIVGVIASGKIGSRHRNAASIIAIAGFLSFAVGNYFALDQVRDQREAAVAFVIAKAGDVKSQELLALATASQPPASWRLMVYHGSLCIFVVALLWFIPKYLPAPTPGKRRVSDA